MSNSNHPLSISEQVAGWAAGQPSRCAHPEHAPDWVQGMVSVITPAFNCEQFLAQTVASVIAQTFQKWELLIIDDASSDGTRSLAQQVAAAESRIRVITLISNGGVANARNVGMRAARGQYLALLDSDDLWLPDKLRIQIEFMKRNRAGFCFSSYRRLMPDGSLSSPVRIPERVRYKDMLGGNLIGCLTVVLDRQLIPPFEMMPERDFQGHEDYIAWLQMLRNGVTAWGIQQALALYRVSTASVSSDKTRMARRTWKVYRQIEHMPAMKALWCFGRYSLHSVLKRLGF